MVALKYLIEIILCVTGKEFCAQKGGVINTCFKRSYCILHLSYIPICVECKTSVIPYAWKLCCKPIRPCNGLLTAKKRHKRAQKNHGIGCHTTYCPIHQSLFVPILLGPIPIDSSDRFVVGLIDDMRLVSILRTV